MIRPASILRRARQRPLFSSRAAADAKEWNVFFDHLFAVFWGEATDSPSGVESKLDRLDDLAVGFHGRLSVRFLRAQHALQKLQANFSLEEALASELLIQRLCDDSSAYPRKYRETRLMLGTVFAMKAINSDVENDRLIAIKELESALALPIGDDQISWGIKNEVRAIHWLAMSIYCRDDRLELDELTRIIELEDQLLSNGEVAWVDYAMRARCLFFRYLRVRDPIDLDRAVFSFEIAIEGLRGYQQVREITCLVDCGRAYMNRYEMNGDQSDLRKATDYWTQAIWHREESGVLDCLSDFIEDLESALHELRELQA